jgi:hypothetical protein
MNEVRTSVKNFPESNARWKNLVFQCFSHFKKIIFFVLLIPLLISCSTPVTLPPPTKYEVKNMQKKEQLIEFLKRLKVALDMNILDDPKKFQEITGFEVLKWTEPNELLKSYAEDWRFNVPAMDSEIELTKNKIKFHRTGYWPKYPNDLAGSFGVDALHLVACIEPSEIVKIFGSVDIAYARQPKPFHTPYVAPFWTAQARLFDSDKGIYLALNYQYVDEQKPYATCLQSIGLAYGGQVTAPPNAP